ncbi:hypothetical protein Taro_006198 [Colocasia esculenta]|uniref:non-specific serine/threonine protein kinase n=1 Tax=Colocasia esculenta TaxID=4460 RepID=A0A843TN42_COLES|nr:hypothetical protein [Colocasia esculenta]
MQPTASIISGAFMLFLITITSLHGPAQPLLFDYPSFSLNSPDFTFQGSATAINGGVIDLTPVQPTGERTFVTGRVVYRDPVRLWDDTTTGDHVLADFITRFSFAVRPIPGNETYTGDGLAFFLSPYGSEIPRAYSAGHFLGLFNDIDNPTLPTFIPTVAVEFDTHCNIDVGDPANISVHVGIDVWSIMSVVKQGWPEIRPEVGATINATISYDAGTKNLSAFFQGNGTHRSLSHVVDLSKVLPKQVSVGFSATTGHKFEIHYLHSWSFNSSLDVSDRHNKIRIGVLVGVPAGVGALAAGLVLAWLCITRQRSESGGWWKSGGARAEGGVDLGMDDGEFEGGRGPKRFAYGDLARATNNFATEMKLGRGGFGDVYRGVLNDPPRSMEVAIKRVAKDSSQGMREYVSEVKIISRLRHRYLVQLVGWCHEIEGELLLVYEYMPNGSLDAHLFGRSGGEAAGAPLSWPTRYGIAQGVAAALLYLHEEWEQCVVHRDVKPSNVMLDANFNAKLGDFGLARLVDHGRGPETTVPAGTMGYLAPECATTGKTSKESDVYSFGVVALEIACGRRPFEPAAEKGRVGLVEWVWDLYVRRALLEAADPKLSSGEFDEMKMERLMVVGLWCAHPDFRRRPSMRQVVSALNFEVSPKLPAEMPVPTYGDLVGFDLGNKTWKSSSAPATGSSAAAGADATGSTSAASTASSRLRCKSTVMTHEEP